MCAVRDKSLLAMTMRGLIFKKNSVFLKIQILEEIFNGLWKDIFLIKFVLVGSFETFSNKSN